MYPTASTFNKLPFHTGPKFNGYIPSEAKLRTFVFSSYAPGTYFPGAPDVQVFPQKFRGLALTWDKTQTPMAVKVAGPGDRIMGRLENLSYAPESQTIMLATVAIEFCDAIPVDPAGAAPAIGDEVIGSLGGMVAKNTGTLIGNNIVYDLVPTAKAENAPAVLLAMVEKVGL